ncbi:MAG: S-methyl-5-thioribose-1-phosphate isomerase [Candidatus Geothermincolales bacterium]
MADIAFRSVDFKNGRVILLDQTRLPREEVYLELTTWEEVCRAIVEMKVRGAPAIGLAAAFGVVLAAGSPVEPRAEVFRALEGLARTRPTAVNLFRALSRMEAVAREVDDTSLYPVLLREAWTIVQEQAEADRRIGELGAELLPRGAKVLTHCNAGGLATYTLGTALGVIKTAHQQDKEIFVWVDETRPLLQGARLTAWELGKEGIPHRVICDNMAGYLMARGEVDAVVVGADRIAVNGDTANKIGTYTLAVLASRHDVPFYVAAPLSTLDPATESGERIPIEERDPSEVLSFMGSEIAPRGSFAFNPAFDVTPADLITAIVTEAGVITRPLEKGIRELFQRMGV